MIRLIFIVVLLLHCLNGVAQDQCEEIEVDTSVFSEDAMQIKINTKALDSTFLSIDESDFEIDIRLYRHTQIYNETHKIYRFTCNGNDWRFDVYEFYAMIKPHHRVIDYYEPVLESKTTVDSCQQCPEFINTLIDYRFFQQENMDLEKYMDGLDEVGHTVDYIFKYKVGALTNSFSIYSPQNLLKLFPKDRYLVGASEIIDLFEEFDEIE